MKRFAQLLVGISLAVGLGNLANAENVTFNFNPADFFSFNDWQDGPGTEGGMFRLHETGGLPGSPTHDSWTVGGHSTLVSIRDSMDDDPRSEGIGYVQAYLLKQPSPGGNAPVEVWGQTLTAGGAPSGTAPTGWDTGGAQDAGSAWVYTWEADSADHLIRPGEDLGEFSLTFPANEPVTMGEDYTLWFSGQNWSGYVPAIDFGPFPGGTFEAVIPDDQPGTSYEVTRSLEAVPEPATALSLLGFGLVMGAVLWRRRRG